MRSGGIVEEAMNVIYCRGRCGRVAHGSWSEIWGVGSDLAFWQRMRCSVWYLVDGGRRAVSRISSSRSGEGKEGDGYVV